MRVCPYCHDDADDVEPKVATCLNCGEVSCFGESCLTLKEQCFGCNRWLCKDCSREGPGDSKTPWGYASCGALYCHDCVRPSESLRSCPNVVECCVSGKLLCTTEECVKGTYEKGPVWTEAAGRIFLHPNAAPSFKPVARCGRQACDQFRCQECSKIACGGCKVQRNIDGETLALCTTCATYHEDCESEDPEE